MDVQKFPLEGFIHLKEVSVAWGGGRAEWQFPQNTKRAPIFL